MGRKCEFSSCNNYQGIGPGAARNVSFFNFPKTDILCSMWVDACRSAQAIETFSKHGPKGFIQKKVCSQHFPATAFRDADKKYRGLCLGAVPVNLQKSIHEEPGIQFIEDDEDFLEWKKITDNTSPIGSSTNSITGPLSCSPADTPHNTVTNNLDQIDNTTSSLPESALFDIHRELYSAAIPVNLEKPITDEYDIEFIENDENYLEWRKVLNSDKNSIDSSFPTLTGTLAQVDTATISSAESASSNLHKRLGLTALPVNFGELISDEHATQLNVNENYFECKKNIITDKNCLIDSSKVFNHITEIDTPDQLDSMPTSVMERTSSDLCKSLCSEAFPSSLEKWISHKYDIRFSQDDENTFERNISATASSTASWDLSLSSTSLRNRSSYAAADSTRLSTVIPSNSTSNCGLTSLEMPSVEEPFKLSNTSRNLQLQRSLKAERASKYLLKEKLKDSRRQLFIAKQACKRRLTSSLKYKRLVLQLRRENRLLQKQKTADEQLGKQAKSNPVIFDSLINANRKPHARRYQSETMRFAAGAYLSGPRTYRYLQRSKKIVLPHKNTVHRYNKAIRMEPGINQAILDSMKKKTKRIKDKRYTITTMCCDGMSVKPELTYCAKTDTFHGFPNDGISRRIEKNNPAKLATEAIVVMVSGLYKRFKQPIAYFLAHNSLDSGIQLKLIKKCITAVRNSGYIPLVLTLDQCSTNLKMAREAGATAEVPLINVNGESIALLYDPPHLIKSARNALFKNNAVFNDMIASFGHVKDLFDIDSSSALRLAPKLKPKSIELPPFAAMNVALATRTLSESCAIAIRYYVQTNELPANALQTAAFMDMHDKLFDIFNSKENYADSVGKPLRAPITDYSDHMKFLDEMLSTLENMYYTVNSCTDIAKAEDESKQLRTVQRRPHYIKGLISNINSLKWLWKVVRTKYNCQHLATNPMCQDCAENFFSEIRRRCGFNDAPNAFQFASAFKYAMLSAADEAFPVGPNCQNDGLLPLLNETDLEVGSFLNPKSSSLCDAEPLDLTTPFITSKKELNAMVYITGAAIPKLRHEKCRVKLANRKYSVKNVEPFG